MGLRNFYLTVISCGFGLFAFLLNMNEKHYDFFLLISVVALITLIFMRKKYYLINKEKGTTTIRNKKNGKEEIRELNEYDY